MTRSRLRTGLLLLVLWLLLAVPVGVFAFFSAEEDTVVAGHSAVVSPTGDGYATLVMGPFVPNVRYPTGSTVGVKVVLGKTNLDSYSELLERYALIGSQPDGQVARLRQAVRAMTYDAALTGALVGLAAPAAWLLLGSARRAELGIMARRRKGLDAAVAVTLTASVVLLVLRPWAGPPPADPTRPAWQPVAEVLHEVPIPEVARPLEIETGLLTSGSQQLLESAFDTYARSLAFYEQVREDAAELGPQLRQPEEGETVALLVTDRHDNVGMDPVARAIGDAGGATVLLNAGDDTSTGEPWEAFSLDSLAVAFEDYEHKYGVAGNHDHGGFVRERFTDLGFTMLDGEVVDGFDGVRILGADDPRSSGLGTWRRETGISLGERGALLAQAACAADDEEERITVVLVHDAALGRETLARGCADLVVAGHLHAQLGPTPVVGENGRTGYTYTSGTTGGATYAVAIGSKLRRDAQVTLITFADGRPIGLQPVTIRTVGDFRVDEFIELPMERIGEPAQLGTPVEPAETRNGPSPADSEESP